MTEPRPEISGVSVVLLGSFNPQIFQPAWFAAENLIRKEEADAAKVEIIHPEIVQFTMEWLVLNVTHGLFHASTAKDPAFDWLRDLALGTFRILRHTPIHTMGLNLDMHFKMPSETEWHAVGHRLAPKEPWVGILENPGMRTLIMEGVRQDGLNGYIRVHVEPSVRVTPGVYIQVNDHYVIEDPKAPHGCEKVMDILNSSWQTSLTRSKKMAYSLLEAK